MANRTFHNNTAPLVGGQNSHSAIERTSALVAFELVVGHPDHEKTAMPASEIFVPTNIIQVRIKRRIGLNTTVGTAYWDVALVGVASEA